MGLYTMNITSFAEADRLGIYTEVDLGLRGSLEPLIEKDFACLNSSEDSADDQFPNPCGASGEMQPAILLLLRRFNRTMAS